MELIFDWNDYTFVDLYELIIESSLDQDNHLTKLLNVSIELLHRETSDQDVHKTNRTL